MGKQIILAAILACVMLVGCAPKTEETTPASIPETIAVTPETTAPVAAAEAAEAPIEEDASPFTVETIPVITESQNSVSPSLTHTERQRIRAATGQTMNGQ